MRFRWKIDELKTFSDLEIIRSIISERISGLNVYAPLHKRLSKILDKLDDGAPLTAHAHLPSRFCKIEIVRP